MSKVMSLRLKQDQVERLERAARRMGRPVSSTALALLEEALRQRDFPLVEFRDSAAGRQAYVKGTRLPVWQVKWLLEYYEDDLEAMAESLGVRAEGLADALRYAEVYREEVASAIEENRRIAEDPQRYIPSVRTVRTDATSS